MREKEKGETIYPVVNIYSCARLSDGLAWHESQRDRSRILDEPWTANIGGGFASQFDRQKLTVAVTEKAILNA